MPENRRAYVVDKTAEGVRNLVVLVARSASETNRSLPGETHRLSVGESRRLAIWLAGMKALVGIHTDHLSPCNDKILDEIFGTEYCPARYKQYREQNGLANSGHRRNLMRRHKHPHLRAAALTIRCGSVALGAMLVLASSALAQTGTSPWENAVNVLQQAFTGPIAKGLALIAIVVGGLTFAFGEGGSKRTFAGIVFGLGMAVLAVNFLSWLFGV